MTRPAPRYHAPTELTDALELLADPSSPTAVLGGATVVMPQLARGELRPDRVLDLARLPGMNTVSPDGTGTRIGATASYTMLRRRLPGSVPVLARLAAGITGGPQIQNQGTAGGSACHANPASDVPTALVALGASMVLAGAGGTRTVPARDFFLAAHTTALRDDELLLHILVPPQPSADGWGYLKLKRSESSWPIVTAAARTTDRANGGRVAAVTVGGAGDVPVTLRVTLTGPRPDDDLAEDLAELLDAAVDRWHEDDLADVAYRRRVAPVVATRAVQDALRSLPLTGRAA